MEHTTRKAAFKTEGGRTLVVFTDHKEYPRGRQMFNVWSLFEGYHSFASANYLKGLKYATPQQIADATREYKTQYNCDLVAVKRINY